MKNTLEQWAVIALAIGGVLVGCKKDIVGALLSGSGYIPEDVWLAFIE